MVEGRAVERIPGDGWLVLVGGGEFSFGETEDADELWLAKAGPGPVGFVPAASGSADYGRHFAAYLEERFERAVEIIPVYRARDARRAKNAERIRAVAAVYLGGGVTDHLLEALAGSPAAAALADRLVSGGVVVAIGAAAEAVGQVARSLLGKVPTAGLGWLPGGVVEPNFDPDHDHRLRRLLATPGVGWGLGIGTGSAVALGPAGAVEVLGDAFLVEGALEEGTELEPLEETAFD